MIGGLTTALHAVVTSSPGSSVAPLLYIIAALLAGGVLNLGWQVYRRWRSGGIDDKKTIEETIEKEIGGLRSLISEYRTEAEVTKRLLGEYRLQLAELTKDLAKAQVRIGYLEDDLRQAKDRRDEIEKELRKLTADRERTESERDRLLGEAQRLRNRIDQLEALAGVTGALARPHDEQSEPAN